MVRRLGETQLRPSDEALTGLVFGPAPFAAHSCRRASRFVHAATGVFPGDVVITQIPAARLIDAARGQEPAVAFRNPAAGPQRSPHDTSKSRAEPGAADHIVISNYGVRTPAARGTVGFRDSSRPFCLDAVGLTPTRFSVRKSPIQINTVWPSRRSPIMRGCDGDEGWGGAKRSLLITDIYFVRKRFRRIHFPGYTRFRKYFYLFFFVRTYYPVERFSNTVREK